MTGSEIFSKAVKKAKLNGFECKWNDLNFALTKNIIVYELTYCFRSYWLNENGRHFTEWFSIYDVIFNHDFAKAFWGDEEIDFKCWDNYRPRTLKSWQYQLQQMVLEEEPLKYLENFL